MQSRREALGALAAGAVLPVLKGQVVPPQAPKHISADDYKLLGQLVDLIIPRTDTPGALDAGVPMYIDRALGKRPELQALIESGLAAFRQFSTEPAVTLTRMEARSDPFFKLLKDLTIDGFYSSREGLVQELGYHGNTYLSEFKGCTHPEHQVDGNAG